jgi:hypothetical protein
MIIEKISPFPKRKGAFEELLFTFRTLIGIHLATTITLILIIGSVCTLRAFIGILNISLVITLLTHNELLKIVFPSIRIDLIKTRRSSL